MRGGVIAAAALAMAAAAAADYPQCKDCPAMVHIPAGSFQMGSADTDEDHAPHEGPVHTVNIRSFWLMKYLVTRGDFARFVNDTGYDASGCFTNEKVDGRWVGIVRDGRSWRHPGFTQTDRDPVVCVSWEDAHAYIDWLRKKTGYPFRLPSEAEWEYAARAKAHGRYYWGDDPKLQCQFLNGADASTVPHGPESYHASCDDHFPFTSPVGSFPANAFGLYDMGGNADEQVEDCHHDSYAGAPSNGSAWVTAPCDRRVMKGGGWDSANFRSATRGLGPPDFRSNSSGFRLALPE